MEKNYYTYCIRIINRDRVLVEMRDAKHQDLGRPSGVFRYQEMLQQIKPLLKMASDNNLDNTDKVRELGEALFDVLFDNKLLYNFVEFYNEVVHHKKQLLRVELDIDEQQMPEVAALPWEFLRVPTEANLGTIWMGTLPDFVFYRRRAKWISAQPIQLERDEKLKIALVVSAPPDLPHVDYERVQKALEKLAGELVNRIEFLPIVNSANPEEIDTVLSKKPHIFHFIGHGRLIKKGDRDVGEIALVDRDFDEAMWVNADYFSGLFARHRPSVMMLQACEGGKLSKSQAFTGVASGIIQQNIPVVVAMQYEVTNSTASRFACRFYQRLAEYKPVDIAAQEGRLAITLGPTQYRKRDFATPVIFMGVEDGYLFKHQDEVHQNSYEDEITLEGKGIKTFISYAYEDRVLRDELKQQLAILNRQNLIQICSYKFKITNTKTEFNLPLYFNEASVILLLISPDFLASSFCRYQINRARERWQNQEAIIIPIRLRPVDDKDEWFSCLKPLPNNNQSVTKWKNRDEAFLDIAQGIGKAIEKINSK